MNAYVGEDTWLGAATVVLDNFLTEPGTRGIGAGS
jgi:hypothetical protein